MSLISLAPAQLKLFNQLIGVSINEYSKFSLMAPGIRRPPWTSKNPRVNFQHSGKRPYSPFSMNIDHAEHKELFKRRLMKVGVRDSGE